MKKYILFFVVGILFIPSFSFGAVQEYSRYYKLTSNVTNTIFSNDLSYLIQDVFFDSNQLGLNQEVWVGCGNNPPDFIVKFMTTGNNDPIPKSDVVTNYVCNAGLYTRASSTSNGTEVDIVIKYTQCDTFDECMALGQNGGNGIMPDSTTQTCSIVDGVQYCYRSTDIYVTFFLEFLVVAITILGLVWVFRKRK